MHLCLACRGVSPRGSAFCGHCARSFGGRLCPNRHRNAPSVRCCTTCGSPALTECARSLRLGWLSSSLAGLCALGTWKWVVAHPILCLDTLWKGGTWILGILLNTSACVAGMELRNAVCWLVACWLAGHALALIPGSAASLVSRILRAVPVWIARHTLRIAGIFLRYAVRRLRSVFWPTPKKMSSVGGKGEDAGHER